MKFKKDKLIKELEQNGFIEIEINDGQITFFKYKDCYKMFLEKWNTEDEDWEPVDYEEQKNIEDVFNILNSRFGIEVI